MIFLNEKNNSNHKRNLLYSRCEFNSQWDTCDCLFFDNSWIRVKVLERAQRMSFCTSNLFLCFVVICKGVENPDSHRYVVTNGRIPWIAFFVTSG